MSKKNKRQSRNEFRYNNSTRHPNYVFEKDGEDYHSVGLTHSEKTFGKKNMPLNKNPKKGKTKRSYVRNGIITDKTNNYSKKTIKNMEFSESDFVNVKSKIRSYKKKRKKKTSGEHR